MKRHKNNIQHILRRWAKDQAHLSERNDEIKTRVMGAMTPEAKTKVKRPSRLLWMTLATSTLVFVVFIGNHFATSRLTPTAGVAGLTKQIHFDTLEDPFGIQRTESSLSGSLGGSPRPSSPVAKIVEVYEEFAAPSIKDTREFLKTGYGAFIKTRHVGRTATRIQTMVRGHGGRIDTASVDERFASISFVIPKSSFDQFTDELHGMVSERFLEENIHMENLLPQKQEIELQTDNVSKRLASLTQTREELVASHGARVGSLQSQINNYVYRISLLNKEKEVSTSTIRQEEIEQDVASLGNRLWARRQELKKENYQFAATLATYDQDISATTRQRDSLIVEDQELVDDVETVEGYISIEWINILELLDLYVPIYWLIGSVVLLSIMYIPFGRRRSFDEDLLN